MQTNMFAQSRHCHASHVRTNKYINQWLSDDIFKGTSKNVGYTVSPPAEAFIAAQAQLLYLDKYFLLHLPAQLIYPARHSFRSHLSIRCTLQHALITLLLTSRYVVLSHSSCHKNRCAQGH